MSVKNFLFVLFFAGCAVRILIFITGHIKSGPEFYLNYGDAGGYTTLAKNLVAGNGFSWAKEPPFLPNGNRTPGYPLFLAASYALGGSFYPVIFLQIILGAVIPIFGYKILKELDFSELVSRIAGIFLAVEPFFAAHSVFLLTEVFFVFLFLSALFLFVFRRGVQKPWYIFAGVAFLLGLAALVRPIGLYLIPIFAFFVFFTPLERRRISSAVKIVGDDVGIMPPSVDREATVLTGFADYGLLRKRAFIGVMILFVGFGTIFPWLWRNYNQFGLMRLTYVDAKNLFYNYAGGTLVMENGTPLEVEQEKLTALIRDAGYAPQDPVFSDFFRQEAKRIIFAHPAAFLKLNALTAWQFFTHDAYYDLAVHLGFYKNAPGPPITILDFRRSLTLIPGLLARDPLFFVFIAGRVFWIAVMFFFMRGAWLSLRNPGNRRRDLLILVLIGYFLAASLTTGYAINARLRLPIFLFYIAYAAVGAAFLRAKLKNIHSRAEII